MKSQVFLFVCLALLIVALGCGVTSNSGGNSSTPGIGAPGSGNGSTGGGGGGSGSGSGSSPTAFLYVIENPNAPSSVEAFSISSTGALTPVSSISAGTNANYIVANSKFVFVSNSPGCCAGTPPIVLLSYSIANSGALTMADQFTNSNDNTDTVTGLTLDSTGADLYAGTSSLMQSGDILPLAVDRSTAKMSLLGPPTRTNAIPGQLVIPPDGRFVYDAVIRRRRVADQGGYELLTRDPATGMLTDTNRLFKSSSPLADFFTDSAITRDGQFLLGVSPNFDAKITVYSVNNGTGDLTIASNLNGDFKGLTVDNTGRFAIATHASGAVSSYKINADGTLTFVGSLSAAAGINNVVVDASNKFVYAENSNATQIFAFTFNEADGSLGDVAGSPFTTSGVPIRMAAGK